MLTGAGVGFAQAVHAIEADSAVWHALVQLRTTTTTSDASESELAYVARLELTAGRPERARALLEQNNDSSDADVLRLLGLAHLRLGEFDQAADRFASAALLVTDSLRGILFAATGDVLERAGRAPEATTYYQRAAALLPALAGWLAIREARITADTTYAFALLDAAPSLGAPLVQVARADALLQAGDTARAVDAYAVAGAPLMAAQLAHSIVDMSRARALGYRALADDDTSNVRAAVRLVRNNYPPTDADGQLQLAGAVRRLGDSRLAAAFVENAIAAGDSSAETALLHGDLLSSSGYRTKALTEYRRAANQDAAATADAWYRRGRLLIRVRRVAEGTRSLTEFADRYPKHDRAPAALFVVADRAMRARRETEADSLYREITFRWPRSTSASQARFRIAASALDRGDSAAAAGWYRREIGIAGSDRFAAQFRLGSLVAASGDSLEARGIWAELARRDSLGYYGTIARKAADLPPMRIEVPSRRRVSPQVVATFATFDLLREAQFEEETDVLLEHFTQSHRRPAAELLDIAERLIERGYMAEGIRLGWVATRSLTLNDPRVLRVIFPWPLRDLIEKEAQAHEVDPYLLAALIRQESAFRAAVVSHAGAHGLMQLMPATARQVARRHRIDWHRSLLHVPDANLHLGVTHFTSLLRRFDGDENAALASYNAGATPVRRWLRYPEAGDPVRWIERVPYIETRGYLKTVTRNRALYRALYPPRP